MERAIKEQFNYYKSRGFNYAFAVQVEDFEFLVTPVKIIAEDDSTHKFMFNLLHTSNMHFHAEDKFLSFELDFGTEKSPEPPLLFDFKFTAEPQFFLS
jgi:hypothetical protein